MVPTGVDNTRDCLKSGVNKLHSWFMSCWDILPVTQYHNDASMGDSETEATERSSLLPNAGGGTSTHRSGTQFIR